LVPRPPAEIKGRDGHAVLAGEARVIAADGRDVTSAFLLGAQRTLELARSWGSTTALLKSRSPSCGKYSIYDGTFRGILRSGPGVTAALLASHGLSVFSEEEVEILYEALDLR
jgi:uncharacterized protein YbbK (DUF523 family)